MSNDEERTIEQLNDEADIAADYLEGLLDIVDYEGDIEMEVRNGRPSVQIIADDDRDIKHLIGRNGEVINALQQLTRLAVQQSTGERSRVIVDIDGYLKEKRRRIKELALDAVDEARETGDVIELRPMNSFERKIVHDTVRDEGLKSRSHGVEPKRYVTIYVKKTVNDDDFDDDLEDEDDFRDDFKNDSPRYEADADEVEEAEGIEEIEEDSAEK